MKKSEFIDELCRRLRLMPPDEAQRTVMFYSEAIDDRVEDGMTEEEAVASLGDMDDIVREVTGSSSGERYGGSQAKWSKEAATSERWIERHYELEPQGLREVRVFDTSCDATVEVSADDKIHIICTEGKGVWYEINNGPILTIQKALKKEINLFGFSIELPFGVTSQGRLSVQLPETLLRELRISVNTTSGDITIRTPELRGMAIKSGSGDINIDRLKCSGEVSVATVSGDAEVREISGSHCSISTVSGDMNVSGIRCSTLKLSSVSGDMEGRELDADEVRCSTVSGDTNTFGGARSRFAANTVSGNITFDLISIPGVVTLESISGAIEGDITGDPQSCTFNSKSTSGRISIPLGGGGPNTVRVKTVSGGISLRFH